VQTHVTKADISCITEKSQIGLPAAIRPVAAFSLHGHANTGTGGPLPTFDYDEICQAAFPKAAIRTTCSILAERMAAICGAALRCDRQVAEKRQQIYTSRPPPHPDTYAQGHTYVKYYMQYV